MSKKLTQEEYIEKVRFIHNNSYEYSKTIYTGNKNKLIITCKEHGDFEQNAASHYKCGCPKCSLIKNSVNRKLDINELINRFVSKHGDKYDYSKVIYIKKKSKIIITCKKHNEEFLQTPEKHLDSITGGCPKCNSIGKSFLNNDVFIEKANLLHSNMYDYSLVNFVKANIKVPIICKEHGIFEMTPTCHLQGCGCKLCYHNNLRKGLENFLLKSKQIHNDKYSYDNIKTLLNYEDLVEINCKIHGNFKQRAINHINGYGCKKCKNLHSKQDFIDLSIKKYGDSFIYDKLVYNGIYDKITLGCKIHGYFTTNASYHLHKNSGCKKCSRTFYTTENEWLDLLSIPKENRQIKVDKYIVDGIDYKNNIIYEFNGDYWHGNLNKYNENDYNQVCKKTFGELYNNTINKKENLEKLGYKVISIWESEFKNKNKKCQ